MSKVMVWSLFVRTGKTFFQEAVCFDTAHHERCVRVLIASPFIVVFFFNFCYSKVYVALSYYAHNLHVPDQKLC